MRELTKGGGYLACHASGAENNLFDLSNLLEHLTIDGRVVDISHTVI